MIKYKISTYLNHLMRELPETQDGLAALLGISKSSLQGYLERKNLPGLDILIRMAEIGGVTLDDLVKQEQPKIQIEIKDSQGVAIAGRDAYVNTTIRRSTQYRPGPDDISGDQANRLKGLVDEIIDLEKKVRRKPKSYGAVWNSLNKRMGVTYYREIRATRFQEAEIYLMQWKGRLKRPLKRMDENEWRKKTYAAIFAAAKNQLGWDKKIIDNYIFEKYSKTSIRELEKDELEQLYNIIFSMKRR